MAMKRTQFGRTDLQVSALGLGCARIGGIFKNEPAQFIELLRSAQDRGINFFDTADMYSQGESEMLIGKAFRGRRDQVIIASKVGYCLPTRRRWIARIKPLVRPLIRVLRLKRERLSMAMKGEIAQNFAPAYIRAAVEASLRRIKTDYLDLLQLHSPPADVIARGDWLDALENLKRAGKLRYYGISCDTQTAADAALSFDSISSLQLPVSLLDSALAEAVLPAAHRGGVAVIARECLANGLLVKPESELDLSFKDLSADAAERRREKLGSLRATAKERGVHLSRLALDYVTGLEGVSVALVGASRVDQLHGTLREFGG
jgi:aryl-alcohol dehydrogenase-like predicted oxidoreductase